MSDEPNKPEAPDSEPAKVVETEVVTAAPPVASSEWKPLFDYLMSPQGHEIAKGFLQEAKDWRRVLLEKNISHAKHNRWLEVGVMALVVAAVCILSFSDKLNPTVGILLGSVVGYFFGKAKS